MLIFLVYFHILQSFCIFTPLYFSYSYPCCHSVINILVFVFIFHQLVVYCCSQLKIDRGHLKHLNLCFFLTVLHVPLLDYGCVVWGECSKENAQRLERLQNQAMRIILHADCKTCTQEMRAKLQLLSLHSRCLFIKLQYVYKIINNINCPKHLTGYLMKRSQRHY